MQVNSSTGIYGQSPGAAAQPLKSLDKDAFLQLFVEQLKNQDPMNPQDSSAFIAQIAQFSMLEQLTNISKELSQIKLAQEMGEASTLLGKQVTVQTSEGEVAGQVEKVTLTGADVQIFINGKGYGMNQVTEFK